MNIHSSPVIVSGTALPPAKQSPDERLTDDCGGKTRVDGRFERWTDRPTGIKGMASFGRRHCSCNKHLLHVVTCSCKTFNV